MTTHPRKPASPPPAYSELDPATPASSSRAPLPSSATSPRAGYGPTAITAQQQVLLPYYDPRSPYALSEANSRARWRFIGGLVWAVMILSLVSVLMGLEIEVQKEPWRGNRWRIGIGKNRGNSDPWSDQ